MRVALLVPEFPPDTIGGGGVVFDALARGYHARGHEVTVISARTGGAVSYSDAGYPFRVVRMREVPYPTPQYRTYMPPLPTPMLARAIAELRRAHVVHAHGYGFASIDLPSALAARERHTVFSLHGFPYTAARSRGPLGIGWRIYDRLIGSRLLSRARRVTAVSSAVVDEATRRGRKDIVVVPNGVDAMPRAPEGIAVEPYLLCVGRLEPLKGFERVVDAVATARKRGRELGLTIVGADSGLAASLRARAEQSGVGDRLLLEGHLPREALIALYHRATACVVASYTESFSLAALEAMSAGCPVIAIPVGGLRDYVEHEANALVVLGDVPDGIADAAVRLAHDIELRKKLIAGGFATAARYAWESVIDAYEALLQTVSRRA